MKIRRIAAIALSNRDFDSLEDKLQEACRWVSLAAEMGCHLAVLPEALNLYCGDGPGNPRALSVREAAMDDWRAACGSLLACARRAHIAITAPVYVRENGGILNCFYLVSAGGRTLGRYVKAFPAPGELPDGVVPGTGNRPINWEGVRVGGAICFDINFPNVFEEQARDGAELFLVPSLTPATDALCQLMAQLQRPMIFAYPAWCRIIDITGRDLIAGGYRHETLRFGFGVPVYVADVNLDKALFTMDEPNHAAIEPILRRYGRAVRIEFDQDNVRFSLESLSDDVPLKRIVKEFGLVASNTQLTDARNQIEAARPRRASPAGR